MDGNRPVHDEALAYATGRKFTVNHALGVLEARDRDEGLIRLETGACRRSRTCCSVTDRSQVGIVQQLHESGYLSVIVAVHAADVGEEI
ncbi:hypothetical protein GCM10023085_47250 [Actinomadura viridis]